MLAACPSISSHMYFLRGHPNMSFLPQCNGTWADETFYTYAMVVAAWGVANAAATTLVGCATMVVEQCMAFIQMLQMSSVALMFVTGGWG